MAGVKPSDGLARKTVDMRYPKYLQAWPTCCYQSLSPSICLRRPPREMFYCCSIFKVEEAPRRSIGQVCVVKVVWIAC